MSAKDLAFKREREKFQSKMNRVKIDLVERQNKIAELDKQIAEKDMQIAELKKQNEELLTLCKMSPEEIRQYIEDKRKVASAAKSLSGMMDIIGGFSL